MSTQDALRKAIRTLQKQPTPDAELLHSLLARCDEDRPLTRDEGVTDHFCSIIIPFVPTSREVFVGHHIKSGLWIPPGGHIDRGETPIQAAVRECREELQIEVSPTDLILFDATSADIAGRPSCTRHMDLWYLWQLSEPTAFQYDRGEFHEAGWHSIDWAITKCRHSAYTHVFQRVMQNA